MGKYKLESVVPADDGKHKFVATFLEEGGKVKKVKFGIAGSYSFVDGAPEKVRQAYLARHIGSLNMEDPTSKSALSYFITWGPFRKIEDNIRAYKNRFKV